MVTESSESAESSTSEVTESKTITELLWDRAIHLSDDTQAPLVSYQNELYKKVMAMRSDRGISKSILEDAETAYWRVTEKIQNLNDEVDKITKALNDFEAGAISEDRLRELLPQEEKVEESEKLSKRKQAIKKERERLEHMGIDPREVEYEYEMHTINFGADSYRFTTGRHQKRIHGNIDPFSATGEFFYRTTDTHGGKVSSGKRAGLYVTANGKRIRKS